LRLIIVVVQVGAVNILAAVQAFRKKETRDETQFTTKFGGKTSLGPSYFPFAAVKTERNSAHNWPKQQSPKQMGAFTR